MPRRMLKHINRISEHFDPNSNLFFSSTNWFLMAFVSGAINAGGFLACHRFVTHVTGFSTLFGVEGANQNWSEAWGLLSVPLFFLLGAMIAAYFIERPLLVGGKPRYYIVNGLMAFILFVVAIGGEYAGFFGMFGEPMLFKRDFALLSLLVLVAGMQNAAATSASSGTVRTTHLTGVTTDVGIGMIRTAAIFERDSENFYRESVLLRARIGIILSFVFGTIMGVTMFVNYKFLGFLLPAFLVFIETLVSIKYKHLFESRHSWLRLEPFKKSQP